MEEGEVIKHFVGKLNSPLGGISVKAPINDFELYEHNEENIGNYLGYDAQNAGGTYNAVDNTYNTIEETNTQRAPVMNASLPCPLWVLYCFPNIYSDRFPPKISLETNFTNEGHLAPIQNL